MNEVALFGLLALAVSQVGWFVADSRVMHSLRMLIWNLPFDGELWELLDDGINCASCVGVWAAFLAACVLRPDFLLGEVWVSVPVYALALAMAARAIHAGVELTKRVKEDT